ncbi:MAG: DUF4258 domain-containing protein [Verrucomicrobiota bacterium]
MALLLKIRQKILDRAYFLSSHAEDEMHEDNLERADVEHAIRHGAIEKRYTSDPRGTRYRVAGPALDGRVIRIVCRFGEHGDLIIITVYAKD